MFLFWVLIFVTYIYLILRLSVISSPGYSLEQIKFTYLEYFPEMSVERSYLI